MQHVITHQTFLHLRNRSCGSVPLHVRVYLSVIEGLGRRKMAVASLRWEDVNFAAEWITWTEETDKEGVRWREVPISRRVARLLRMRRTHSKGEWAVESPKARPYGKSAVDQWRRDLYAAAGIPKPFRSGWHSYRRKLATDTKGESTKDVMEVGRLEE